MTTLERAKFARNIVDSYTLNADELALFIDYIEKQPTALESDLCDWLCDTITTRPSAREMTAVIRAVRYLPLEEAVMLIPATAEDEDGN